MNTNMIEQSRRLYEQGIAPMIRRKFPEYESRIAAGMAGEGSDCFGYDDRISQDHDYGVGVCLWLTDEDAKQIGSALQSAYQQAAAMWLSGNRAAGASPEGQSGRLHHLHQRRGAQTIRQFYYTNLNVMIDPAEPVVTDGIWFYTDEWRFAAAVNGAVFRDDLGQFTRIRELLLRYYPDRIWRMRLANALHNYASAMQANYARCMARKDPVAAAFCKTRSIDAAMDILFLVRRRFAPYYKWKFRAFQELEGSGELAELLAKAAVMEPDPSAWEDHEYSSLRINEKDPLVMLFEKIAALLVRELKDAGLTDSSEVFLEAHCGKVSAGIRSEGQKGRSRMEQKSSEAKTLMEEVIQEEWRQFDLVQNQGGRASCQDNWETFRIMRTAQFRSWPAPLLESYLQDLKDAAEAGWNLITEKYARMMESTVPEEFEQLRDRLPYRSPERLRRQERVIAMSVAWDEAFRARYPNYARRGRRIRTSEDTPYATSSETYLRGELTTYSDRTYELYEKWIDELESSGANLAEITAEYTAREYGYASVAELEERLAR